MQLNENAMKESQKMNENKLEDAERGMRATIAFWS